jgi:hypothetical protein
MNNENYLLIPMSMLYRVRDIESFDGLQEKNVNLLLVDYSRNEIERIMAALEASRSSLFKLSNLCVFEEALYFHCEIF